MKPKPVQRSRLRGPVTQRDVALQAGVSVATVSLALRAHPSLPADTCARVQQAAREMGYQANPVLAALSAHRWRRHPQAAIATLAALEDFRLEGEAGMAERAAACGYQLEVFRIHEYPDPGKLSDVLYARGISGLLVGQIATLGFCAAFDWSRFVSVACSQGMERPPVNLVMPNHFRAVQQAWDWAWARGFQRIGLVLLDESSAIDPHDRHAAFLERQLHVPAERRVPMLAVQPWVGNAATPPPGQMRHRDAVQRVRTWMRQEAPDIVIGFNDAVRWLLHDAGWRVSDWHAFVDLWISHPQLDATGTRLLPDELGRRAVDWLDSLLRTGERGLPRQPATMSVDFEWQDGIAPPTPGLTGNGD